MQMGIYMKETGLIINVMGMVFIYIRMEQNMKENGKMINKKGKVIKILIFISI